MGVSKNRGEPPQIIHFNRVFPYKPSILGIFPLFLVQHPYHKSASESFNWPNWPSPSKAEAKNPSCSLAKPFHESQWSRQDSGLTLQIRNKNLEKSLLKLSSKSSSQHPSRSQRGSTINSRSTALKVLRTSPFAPHFPQSQAQIHFPP